MIILQYLIQIGIVQLLYSFIIYWIVLLLAMLMALLNLKTLGMYIVKLINYYLYTSLLGLITLAALKTTTSLFYGLLIIVFGLFFTFITIGKGMYDGQKEAVNASAFDALDGMKYDDYFLIGSMAFFVIVLFFPSVSIILPVRTILLLIAWIYKLPVIGFVLSLVGFYSMLGTLLQFTVISIAGIISLKKKLKI